MTVSTGMQIPARGRYSRAPGELPVNENVGYNTYVPGSRGIQTLDTSSFNLAKQAASISAEGGQDIVNALKGVGNSFRKLADTGVEIFRKNNELDMYKAQDLYSRLETLWLPKQEQLNELKGGDAVGASSAGTDVANDTETWIKEQKSVFGKEVEKLGSPAARRYFNLHSEELFTRASVWAKDRRNEQINVYEDGVAEASLASTSDSVVAAGGDIARAAQLYGQAMARIDATAARKGWSPEQTEQKKKEWAEKTALKSIQASIDAQDFSDALKRFQHFAPYLMGGDKEKAFNAVAESALNAALSSEDPGRIQEWMRTFGHGAGASASASPGSTATTPTATSAPVLGGVPSIPAGNNKWNAVASEQMTKYRGTKYNLYGESPEKGSVSCSNWVKHNLKAMGITGYTGSSEDLVVKAMENKSVSIEDFERNPRAGLLIGLDHGPRSYDQGRANGIDHVVFTYQDPKSGKIMVSEAGVRGGVHTTEASAWLKAHPIGNDKKVKGMWIGDVLYGNSQATTPQAASGAAQASAPAPLSQTNNGPLAGLVSKAQKALGDANYRSALNAAAADPNSFAAQNLQDISARYGGLTSKQAQDARQYAHSLLQNARARELQAKHDRDEKITDSLLSQFGAPSLPPADRLRLAEGAINAMPGLTQGDKYQLLATFGAKVSGLAHTIGNAALGEYMGKVVRGEMGVDEAEKAMMADRRLEGQTLAHGLSWLQHATPGTTQALDGFFKAADRAISALPPMLHSIGEEVKGNVVSQVTRLYNEASPEDRLEMDKQMRDVKKRDSAVIQQILNAGLAELANPQILQSILQQRQARIATEQAAMVGQKYKQSVDNDMAFLQGAKGVEPSGDSKAFREAYVTVRDARLLKPEFAQWAALNPEEIPDSVAGITSYGMPPVQKEQDLYKPLFSRPAGLDYTDDAELETWHAEREAALDRKKQSVRDAVSRLQRREVR